MAFKDLDEFFEDTLSLPVGGKTYVVPGPSAETGLWAQRLIESGKAAYFGKATAELDDDEETNVYQRVLGPAFDEMVANGVLWKRIQHCGVTALIWCAGNEAAAEQYWEHGQSPEFQARAQNRATRRSGSKKKTGSAAATTTRKATSTNGTKKRG
jgi:hypothetical protein